MRIRISILAVVLAAGPLAAEEARPANPYPAFWAAVEAAWTVESVDSLLAKAGKDILVSLPGIPQKRYSRDQARQVLTSFFEKLETDSFIIADKTASFATGTHAYRPAGGGDAQALKVFLSLTRKDGALRLDEIRKLDG